MNSKHFTKGLLFGASLLLATAAFAGEKASVKVYESVKVNGTTLAPGKYDLAWEGTGSTVQLSIRQGSNTVATVPAAVETVKIAPAGTGYSRIRSLFRGLSLALRTPPPEAWQWRYDQKVN